MVVPCCSLFCAVENGYEPLSAMDQAPAISSPCWFLLKARSLAPGLVLVKYLWMKSYVTSKLLLVASAKRDTSEF